MLLPCENKKRPDFIISHRRVQMGKAALFSQFLFYGHCFLTGLEES